MSPRLRHLLVSSTALLALGSVTGCVGPRWCDGRGRLGDHHGRRDRQRQHQPVEPARDHQLVDVQHRLGRDDDVRAAELVVDRAQPRHRRPRPLRNLRHAQRQRPRVRDQPRRHPDRAGRRHQYRWLPRFDQRHQELKLHGRADELQHPRPAGRLDRQPRHRSRRRAAASRRWWRPACATPARSRRRSAPSRSPPATRSRSTSTATS